MTLRTGLAVLSLVLSIGIGFAISQRRSTDEPRSSHNSKPLIGLSLGTLAEERWQRDRDLFVARANELGAQVLVLSGNGDGMRQNRDVEALISRGVDVLVIVAFDPAAMAKAVAATKSAGIPVICYDRMITDCDVDLYISFDNFEVGQMQAQYLVNAIPTGGSIVRVSGPKTDHTARLFRAGQDSVLLPLLQSGKITMLRDDFAEGWRPAEAKKIVTATITSEGHSIDGILATNDGCAGGAIQALIEEGIAGDIVVTGQDGDLAACQRILHGQQTMTVYKPLKRLATKAADVALDLASSRIVVAGQTIHNGFHDVPSILVPAVTVDRANIYDTVVADGFHSRELLE